MKLLIVAPYHVSGTLNLWQEELRRRGHECRYVTLFPSPFGFREDICLDLPLQPNRRWIVAARRLLHRLVRGPLADDTPIEERPPWWRPPGPLARAFFRLRDAVIAPRIRRAFREYGLDDFDIVWLDQGAEFFRDGRTARRWAAEGKPLMAFYHGSDMRNRGIYSHIDEHLQLRLTSEVDLLELDERLEYLFLPVRTDQITPVERPPHGRLRIVHAARVRAFKGTDRIIEVVRELETRYPVELVLIENMPHARAMAVKATADIVVDQIADTGGWGYGMSSVESLCMGIPTCTRMRPEMEAFLPDHPFVHVTSENLGAELVRLIEDDVARRRIGRAGREWVVRHHDVRHVTDRLFDYFRREGWLRD
jgi:glycosyltransferase involved in cell wall biosynthesis